MVDWYTFQGNLIPSHLTTGVSKHVVIFLKSGVGWF